MLEELFKMVHKIYSMYKLALTGWAIHSEWWCSLIWWRPTLHWWALVVRLLPNAEVPYTAYVGGWMVYLAPNCLVLHFVHHLYATFLCLKGFSNLPLHNSAHIERSARFCTPPAPLATAAFIFMALAGALSLLEPVVRKVVWTFFKFGQFMIPFKKPQSLPTEHKQKYCIHKNICLEMKILQHMTCTNNSINFRNRTLL